MVNSDETLAELLTTMRSNLQVSVGEALASSEASAASTQENENTEASEETTEEDTNTVTTHTIRATDVVNIRKSDSETADILSKTSKGDEYKQLEALANGWSKIEYNGSVAYVKTEFFEVIGEETVEAETTGEDSNSEAESTDTTAKAENTDSSKVISSAATGKMMASETVKLRKNPSTESDVLEVVYEGSQVNVVEQYENGWAKVEYSKKTGYIKSEYLKKE